MPTDELAESLSRLDDYWRTVLPRMPSSRAFFSDPNDLASVRMIDFGGGPAAAPEFDHGFFLTLSMRPHFQALGVACLGEPIAAQGSGAETDGSLALFNKTAGKSGETPPHQDNFYFCLDPPSCLTIWVTLDEITPDGGALRYLPYSHLEGPCRAHTASFNLGFSQRLCEYSETDQSREVVLNDLKPGDAVVHHCQVVHRAEENTAPISSGQMRRAFGVVFRGASANVDEAAHAAHIQSIKEQGLPGGGAAREALERSGSGSKL